MTKKKILGFLGLLVGLSMSGECLGVGSAVEIAKAQEQQKKDAEKKKKQQEKDAAKKKQQDEKEAAKQKKEDEKLRKQQEKDAQKQKKSAAAQGKKTDPKCMQGCQRDRDEHNSGNIKMDLDKYDVCTRKC